MSVVSNAEGYQQARVFGGYRLDADRDQDGNWEFDLREGEAGQQSADNNPPFKERMQS